MMSKIGAGRLPRGQFGTQTRNLFFRRELLYSVELTDHACFLLKGIKIDLFRAYKHIHGQLVSFPVLPKVF